MSRILISIVSTLLMSLVSHVSAQAIPDGTYTLKSTGHNFGDGIATVHTTFGQQQIHLTYFTGPQQTRSVLLIQDGSYWDWKSLDGTVKFDISPKSRFGHHYGTRWEKNQSGRWDIVDFAKMIWVGDL